MKKSHLGNALGNKWIHSRSEVRGVRVYLEVEVLIILILEVVLTGEVFVYDVEGQLVYLLVLGGSGGL